MRLASVRPAIAGFLAVFPGFASGLWAKGEVTSLEALRKLEARVQEVVEKALPATVSLYSNTQGSSGSGVIVSKDGLILTAGHVVEGQDRITVVFPDGKQAKGKVLGANLSKDAAMVRIEGEGPWPYVETGDSKSMEVGDFVVSLGHAGGFDARRTPPVRFGRVVGRNALGFLATDCTLIGGDSGGPLFDLDGRVIGIHSSIGPDLMANNHSGVANFKADWDRLARGDTWGRLTMNPLMNPDRPVIGFNVERSVRGGIVIGEVFPDSPAAVAGLKPGDVVRRVDDQPVGSLRALQGVLAKRSPGDRVLLSYSRDGEEVVSTLKLARLADVLGDDE